MDDGGVQWWETAGLEELFQEVMSDAIHQGGTEEIETEVGVISSERGGEDPRRTDDRERDGLQEDRHCRYGAR